MSNLAGVVPFKQIPQDLNLPLFWAEIDPSLANTATQQQTTLIVGQALPTGSACVSAETSAATASGAVLTFSSVPAGVTAGMYAFDSTTPAAIAAGNTVLEVTSTTVTLAEAVASEVASGDTIVFGNLTPQLVQSAAQAVSLFGTGSMLADQLGIYRLNDSFGQVWCLPLLDDPAAVAASGSILIAGEATATGVIPFYIAGVSLPVIATTTMTASEIATALAAAINAAIDPITQSALPVTASASTATVTVTARNKGLAGNDIDLRLAYYGPANGEAVPPGLAITITPMTSGATNPSTLLTAVLDGLGDTPYDFIVNPYTDSNSLNALQLFLNDVSGRWAWSSQIYGHAFAAKKGTVSALQTFGVARNDQHATVMGFQGPATSWKFGAALTAACAVSVRADAGTPLHLIALQGILAPWASEQFVEGDRNTLAGDGVSTFTVVAGQVITETVFTTYQQNASGQPDNSYRKVETMFGLMRYLRYRRTQITTQYARVKLADDGTRFGPGANIVTPSIIKAFLAVTYADLVTLGWVQDVADYAANLIVTRNAANPNRVDVLDPVVLINQLDVFALLAQFRLSSASFVTAQAA